MAQTSRAHLLISGIVQGVFFRAHSRDIAQRLNLTGWVRNLPNGMVEIVAEGDITALKEFVEWCHIGPPGARVREVEIKWEEPTGEFRDFEIKYKIGD
uniref:Acylphosphatase n=1 Tax=candidate division WOR-3 bacterium TaxID=2052148 RepID=A0A7C4TF05_UNCW3